MDSLLLGCPGEGMATSRNAAAYSSDATASSIPELSFSLPPPLWSPGVPAPAGTSPNWENPVGRVPIVGGLPPLLLVSDDEDELFPRQLAHRAGRIALQAFKTRGLMTMRQAHTIDVQTSMVLQLVMDTLSQKTSTDVKLACIQTARRTEIKQTLLEMGEIHVWLSRKGWDELTRNPSQISAGA